MATRRPRRGVRLRVGARRAAGGGPDGRPGSGGVAGRGGVLCRRPQHRAPATRALASGRGSCRRATPFVGSELPSRPAAPPLLVSSLTPPADFVFPQGRGCCTCRAPGALAWLPSRDACRTGTCCPCSASEPCSCAGPAARSMTCGIAAMTKR